MILPICILLIVCVTLIDSELIDFEEIGGIPDSWEFDIISSNGAIMNKTLNSLKPGDKFVVGNKTFNLIGGILVTEKITDAIFQIDGTLKFSNDRNTWPKNADGSVMECFQFNDIERFKFTSGGSLDNRGTLDGNGQAWWGPIKYLIHESDRPRLMHILKGTEVIWEKLVILNPPKFAFVCDNAYYMTIRHSEIDVFWNNSLLPPHTRHSLLDLTAFNTDGFDLRGKYVHVHDVRIWNDDDCLCVKDGPDGISEHMVFERIWQASGVGLTIGSVPSGARINNITFKDAYMPSTFKGIYMKTRWDDAGPDGYASSITNILYKNITMDSPQQFAVWLGPAQQDDQPCPLYWPQAARSECKMSGHHTWENITLKDIFINNPHNSPGVLLFNATNPIRNLVLDNVIVTGADETNKPWGNDYYCVEGSIVYVVRTQC